MNIFFLLIPKKKVEYLYSSFTVRQAVEKMNASGYSMIPVLDKKTGKYVRSINSSDILNYITKGHLSYHQLEDIPLSKVPSARETKAVSCYAKEEELISKIVEQNYVPVLDDEEVFIGIVTRKAVMNAYILEKGISEEK